MSAFNQLVRLRSIVDKNPEIEFMCHTADDYELLDALKAIQKKIKSYKANTSCLVNIFNGFHGRASHKSERYQAYRLQWLDALIEEHK